MDSSSVGQPVKGLYVPITTLGINNNVKITLQASFEISNITTAVGVGFMRGTTFIQDGALYTTGSQTSGHHWFLHVIVPSQKPLLFYGGNVASGHPSVSESDAYKYTLVYVSSPIGRYINSNAYMSNFYDNSYFPLSTYYPELLDKYVYVPLDMWYNSEKKPVSFTVSSIADNTGDTPIYYEPAD